MLVLSRKSGEQIQIGDNITVTVVKLGRNAVQISVDGPEGTTVICKDETEKSPYSLISVRDNDQEMLH